MFRTMLFAPANHERRVAKALRSEASAVILDLEDAVAESEKELARNNALKVLIAERLPKLYVRVNGLTTSWCRGDIDSLVRKGLDGLVVPMIETVEQLFAVEWLVSSLERDRGLIVGSIDIMPIIETAKGFANLHVISRSLGRCRRLSFGAGDFTYDLGMQWSRDELELLTYRSQLVLASRAAGVEPPIDTVWIDLDDSEGFKLSAQRGKALGFQGKMCIHPDQVQLCKGAYAPTEEEISNAREIVERFAEAERQGLASIRVKGRFIDYPIAFKAQRILDENSRSTG
jgi:citrate lyase subunit beta / citryl-CoA lyase